jgi:hypothetical protein
MSVVICTKHCLQLCTKSHERKAIYKKKTERSSDYSWMAPNDDELLGEGSQLLHTTGLFKRQVRTGKSGLE